jgi:uncharacterized lipoprotein
MGKLRAVILVLAVATLAACSSGSASTAAAPPSAASVAAQLGATDVQHIDPTLYAYDEATATLNGKAVDIATFRTDALRDQWVTVASQFSGIESKGDRYAVADG